MSEAEVDLDDVQKDVDDYFEGETRAYVAAFVAVGLASLMRQMNEAGGGMEHAMRDVLHPIVELAVARALPGVKTVLVKQEEGGDGGVKH